MGSTAHEVLGVVREGCVEGSVMHFQPVGSPLEVDIGWAAALDSYASTTCSRAWAKLGYVAPELPVSGELEDLG